jgi:arginyl-tRNA synthetase
MNALDDLRASVEAAAAALADGDALPRAAPTLERPKRADFGDYSTNAAMLLAPVLNAKPRDVAERLADALREQLGGRLERLEIAGPGFLNVFLSDAWHADALQDVLAAGDAYGRGAAEPRERVNVEFVSANPTGPLTAAGGRHAAYGDALARLLAFQGHTIQREYYVNDFGTQVLRLGESIRARARNEEVPEDGYRGDYVTELAAAIEGAADGDPADVARRGVALLVEGIEASLCAFRVRFDDWVFEHSLHERGDSKVEHAFERLREQGHVYDSEGALWLRTTAFGDDKDRVLRRSGGEHTYFASDIAYHLDKRERGWERLIDVWGADHHGYVGRMRAAFAALGEDPEALELLIMQFVNVIEGGERASMSKRRGEFVTLDELVADIGVDAARFFLLQRSHDTTVDLDLELAREQSRENPVYYVQYAHARCASILREAPSADGDWEGLALHPSERDLVKKLLGFPGEAREAAERRAPHRIAAYALELAQVFTAFYRDCPVLKAEPEALRSFRLAEVRATQRTIARALELLGVTAPESM